jgi:hypothetical protein
LPCARFVFGPAECCYPTSSSSLLEFKKKKKKNSNTNFLAPERTDKTVEGISWLPGPIAMMDLKRRRRPNSFFNGKNKKLVSQEEKNQINVDCYTK